jgi:hypothetical protein
MTEAFKTISKCKVCGSHDLVDVIHLAPQHLSATFVKTNKGLDIADIKVPMTLTLCDKSKNPKSCGLLQLREEVNPDLLYRQYFYRSATNDMMRTDLKDVITSVSAAAQPKNGDIVIDIGANDCTTLQFYPDSLTRVGYEPAQNINWSDVPKDIKIINDYFNAAAFEKSFPGKKAKVVTCNAMFYDLSDPNTFVQDVKKILADDGVWSIQLSYLPLMIENMNFYDICHEHLSYYSMATLKYLLEQNGLYIFQVSQNHVNGGSLRAFVTHDKNKHFLTAERAAEIKKFEEKETAMKLDQPSTFKAFSEKMDELAAKVRGFIEAEIKKGNRVVGLGASTKGNVLLQFFGITKEHFEFISERNTDKVGLRTLGTDFELISEQSARDLRPSSMLVLPWYFKDEIVKRENDFIKNGGSLLMPMPHAHLVTAHGEVSL